MPAIDLQLLVRRLSSPLSQSLESAAAHAVRRGHDSIDLAHWMAALSETEAGRDCFESIGVDHMIVMADAVRTLDEMPRGASGTPAIAQPLLHLAREAWLVASLTHGRSEIACADLLLALLSDVTLRAAARGISPAMRSADTAALAAQAAALPVSAPRADGQPAAARPIAGTAAGGEDFIAQYTQDLTADAAAGRIDPVIGRDRELRQMIDILLRRRQNNPILVGEAGVGKTAVAEAFALQINAGDVPEKLRNVRLLSLDLSLLQAGAGVKGEFERRLRGLVDAVKASAQPVILFIDEAHGLIGAGNQPGTGDAANILKPSLARGELRTIAATTWGEYKKYIERDAALTRRFQPVKVDEPDEETAVRMLRGVADSLEKHHGIRIRESALHAAVRLSMRYIPARQLPDKAISLVDTAAAAVAFSRQSTPGDVTDLEREHSHLGTEDARLEAEPLNEDLEARRAAIAASRADLAGRSAALSARLDGERALADEADRLEGEANGKAALAEVEAKLATLQDGKPLVRRIVDAEVIADVVARWTGIPVTKLARDDVAVMRDLAARLKGRVVGQDAALDALAAAMRISRARLNDPRRPTGVFLMVGMSGVGKTETALALADLLYGGPQHLTTINMSEFKEEHKVSMLVGSPPGYVGFGEGGVLTEAVRRKPYGVLLLDEMDKAHPGVQDVFYQVFDKGTLRDGEGRDIDFKNTTILMTANTGSDVLEQLAADPETMPEGEALLAALKESLTGQFKPAFLGRTTILPYRPLDRGALEGILDLQIAKVRERVLGTYGCALTFTLAAREALLARVALGDTGARALETAIARDVLPALSAHFLEAVLNKGTRIPVEIHHSDDGFRVRAVKRASKPPAPQSAAAEKPVRSRRNAPSERVAV
ncbi:type VI secretion system ATPase TssH [Xanthobacteraceae bacterium A53D]